MLSLQDCLDLADLTESEITSIAKHEHIPPIVALELGQQLLRTPEGLKKLRQFLVDDIAGARARHNCRQCERFSQTLEQYIEGHPECREADSARALRLLELVAIGQAQRMGKSPDATSAAHRDSLASIEDAKRRDDCCACMRLSRELVRALDPGDEEADQEQG